MRLAVISFTQKGTELSEQLIRRWQGGEISLFTKCSAGRPGEEVRYVQESVGEWAGRQLAEKRSLLFIGACGIAVRAVAPWLTDKLHDSPVLVMDERGRYVIPLLSGHMGGANELARRLAEEVGAVPVITTATDINKKFAVDLFAKSNGLYIENKEGIARVSAKALAGEELTLSVETGHFREEGRLPEGLRRLPYPPEEPVDILVTGEETLFSAGILLRPREYAVGVGCKRGKEGEKLEELIGRRLKEAGVPESRVFALASIDRKKDEEGLLSWSRRRNLPFLTYTAEELSETAGEFHGSAFVRERMGVDNVCERAAVRACGPGGRLVCEKYGEDGMTVAVAKREWSVGFETEQKGWGTGVDEE